MQDDLTITYGTAQAVLQPGQDGGIGRNDGNVLVVDDPSVSREHLRITSVAGGWVLENLGRAGTFLDGRVITEPLRVSRSTEIRLAAPDGPAIELRLGTDEPKEAASRPDARPEPRADRAGFAASRSDPIPRVSVGRRCKRKPAPP